MYNSNEEVLTRNIVVISSFKETPLTFQEISMIDFFMVFPTSIFNFISEDLHVNTGKYVNSYYLRKDTINENLNMLTEIGILNEDNSKYKLNSDINVHSSDSYYLQYLTLVFNEIKFLLIEDKEKFFNKLQDKINELSSFDDTMASKFSERMGVLAKHYTADYHRMIFLEECFPQVFEFVNNNKKTDKNSLFKRMKEDYEISKKNISKEKNKVSSSYHNLKQFSSTVDMEKIDEEDELEKCNIDLRS